MILVGEQVAVWVPKEEVGEDQVVREEQVEQQDQVGLEVLQAGVALQVDQVAKNI